VPPEPFGLVVGVVGVVLVVGGPVVAVVAVTVNVCAE
jgi:hypothetical protein